MSRIALLFLCVAFGLGSYVVLENWRFANLTPVNKMQQLWDEDMEFMEESHMLPPAWKSIREIELSPGSKESLDWIRKLRVPVAPNKQGKFKLQVLFLPWEEDGKAAVFLQYDITDPAANGNTVWEISRTLILSDDNSLTARLMTGRKVDWAAELGQLKEMFGRPAAPQTDAAPKARPVTPAPRPSTKVK